MESTFCQLTNRDRKDFIILYVVQRYTLDSDEDDTVVQIVVKVWEGQVVDRFGCI